MKLDTYNQIVQCIRKYHGPKIHPRKAVEKYLCKTFPDVPPETLESIYGYEYRHKMMKVHPKCNRKAHEIYDRYARAINMGEPIGILLKLSEELDLSPALLARLILEQHYERVSGEEQDSGTSRKAITRMLRDTTLISDKDLAYEVYLCVLHDEQYGPLSDCARQSLGQEYETHLQQKLQALGVPFRDEQYMRGQGFDKTPDFKLEVPIAIGGFVINWIESKALFGDESSHANYLKEQYLSYWNRFGPGMVIYWLGFVDTIQESSEKRFIIRENMSTDEITFMNPASIDQIFD